nr:TonB-dependent receptor [uncultured Macellibacteroides sp.]
MKKNLGFLLLMLLFTTISHAQVTTSAITGKIVDTKKEVLPGAAVIAVHIPSGTMYSGVSNGDGYYSLMGMKPGGPYRIETSFIGYEKAELTGVTLPLGETYIYNPVMSESSIALNELVIVGTSGFNTQRTGASANISAQQLQVMPSISRSIGDFTRLIPQAASTNGGTSFSGANNRYNSFQVDGVVNNDVFGLAGTGTNGGQAGIQPISLDAIEQIQVVIAPYDVRQSGFTGGGINAITKSGSNEFKGSAYFYGNNQDFVGTTAGKDVKDRTKLDKQTDMQYGLSLGGALIKNKLFFFVNGEITDKSYPTSYNVGDGSNVTKEEADQVMNHLKSISGGYNGGGYGSQDVTTKSYKILERIDWNINENNKFTLRHSYVSGKQLNFSLSANGLRFNDNGYYMNSKTHTFAAELNTKLSNTKNNELRFGYTRVRDSRDFGATPFPYIKVKLDNLRYIEMGTERYSTANTLDQDIFTLTDNFNWSVGSHQLTFGTHNELFQMENLFIRENFGSYVYSSLADFLSIGTANEAKPEEYNYSYSNETITGSKSWAPSFGAMQLGLYAQDKWSVTDNFNLTYGLRVDMPIYLDKPGVNTKFNTSDMAVSRNLATNNMPGSTPLFSPRVGFRWDINSDNSFLLRGGAGIFTGRIPFVWISNSFSNTGIEYVRTRLKSSDLKNMDFKFNADPANQPSGKSMTSEVDVVSDDFKYPQSFRVNLAVEKMLPYDVRATVEGIYTKKMNDIFYQNINIEESGKTLNNFGDKRPLYGSSISSDYTSVILLSNSSEGYSYNITGKLEKTFDFGLDLMAAYTYGQSKGVNDGTSSQAYSNWSYNENWRGSNNPEVSYTDFDQPHRIIASASYKVSYGKNFATSVALFYNGNSGSRYSLCYNGDLNKDGVNGNDLLYVPTDAEVDAMNFKTLTGLTPDQQKIDLKGFLASEESGLSDKRGGYAERNELMTPFEHHFDLRLMQDFYIMVGSRKHTLQVNLDVLNIGNLFNRAWGTVNSPGYSYTPIKAESVTADGAATFSFTKPSSNKLYNQSDYNSRWRAQIGVRYIF